MISSTQPSSTPFSISVRLSRAAPPFGIDEVRYSVTPATGTLYHEVAAVKRASKGGGSGRRVPRQAHASKVRDAVADLAINPNTVLKAYRELEHKGLASGRPGQGTFITATVNRATLPELTDSAAGWGSG